MRLKSVADTVENLADVGAWLTESGLNGSPVETILAEFCSRANAAGLRLARVHVSMSTLHPLFRAYGFTWRATTGQVEAATFFHADQRTEGWIVSPFAYMLQTGTTSLRRRLAGDAPLDFPVLQEFREQGMTDWYAGLFGFGVGVRVEIGGEMGLVVSVASDLPGGFNDSELQLLRHYLPLLALAIKGTTLYQIASSLLSIYLGADSARRVLAGEIRRGTVQSLPAVLFYADLRGFTQFADTTETQEVVALLDQYFEAMATPIENRGGQVLKFMGDGLLATFAVGTKPLADLCHDVLDAVGEALAGVGCLNAARTRDGRAVMQLDIAVHLGDVLYGNVGTDSRLDFTVVGPAVNEAARMEALCRELGCRVVISERFAQATDGCRHRLKPLGRHQLRGVRDLVELYTMAEELAAP